MKTIQKIVNNIQLNSILKKQNNTISPEYFKELVNHISSLKFNKKYNFVWVNNPKVAGSKICTDLINIVTNNSLSFKELHNTYNHIHLAFHKLNPENLSELTKAKMLFKNKQTFKFKFVRNPYSRVFTAWKYFFITLYSGDNNEYTRIARKQVTGAEEDIQISFEEFINYIYKHWQETNSFTDDHWGLQHKITHHDLIKVDFIGKQENFNEDYSYVLQQIKAPSTFLKQVTKKANTSEVLNYKNYYTKELQEKVLQMYEKDFKTFCYSKDINKL